MNFKQSFKTQIKQIQSLKQVLNPKLIKMLKTFSYSYDELYSTIKEEQETNQFINIIQEDSLRSYSGSKHTSSYEGIQDFTDLASDSDTISLTEFLNQQLPFENLNAVDTRVAKSLIEELDKNGYLKDYPTIQAKITVSLDVSPRKVNDILKVIQTLEPDGVGARSLQECLSIQIDHYHFESEMLRTLLKTLISTHFDALANAHYAEIAEKLNVTEEGVESMHLFIKENLNPYPGSAFSSSEKPIHITPSFEVKIENGDLKLINLEEEKGIRFNLSSQYLHMVKDPTLDKETKLFLENQLEKAKALLEALEQRKENLKNLINLIVHIQDSFFRKGLLYLVPLQQNTISTKLGISASTVSRIVSSKYIITPYGTFSLKELCPRSHFGYTKERLSALIKDVYDRYPTESDQKIANRLQGLGLKIARRTITKYRHSWTS